MNTEKCPKGGDHCWHTGSGMDSGCYNSDGSGSSTTHYKCCWCGIIKTERREWKATDQYEGAHGDRYWSRDNNQFNQLITIKTG
jgi:hypothetical protein